MKSRFISIILYILTFILLIFFTTVVIINGYYTIPYNTSGVDLSRSFTVLHDIIFGIVAFVFALFATYCFLSVFGKIKFKEVFKKERSKVVYISCVSAFGIVYFMTELLVGYIVLNIKDPNAFINGNTYGNIVVTEDKSLNNVYSNSSLNNINMISIDGKYTLNISDSSLINYGNNVLSNRGFNTIINEKNGATFNGDRIMFTLTGTNSEVAYLNNSVLRLFNSNISVEDESSIFIYSDKSEVYTNSSSLSSSSKNPIVVKNGSTFYLERSNFVSEANCNDIFKVTSDDNSVNIISLKNGSIAKGNYNIFNIDSSKTIINLSDLKIDWIDIEKYIAEINDSDVTININNCMITGNINFDTNSNLKVNLEESQFIGSIVGDNGFELSMDDSSIFTSPGSIHLSKFNGSEIAFRKVISVKNDIKLDTEI